MTTTGGGTGEAVRPPAGGASGPGSLDGSGPGRVGRVALRDAVVGATALLVGVLLLGAAALARASVTPSPPPAPPAHPPTSRPALGVEPAPTVPAAPAVPPGAQPTEGAGEQVGPPVSISIPDLGIDQRLVGLRVGLDGTMQVPSKWMDIGWWSSGPAPGEPGGAVIAGHVNGGGKPAVFAGLAQLTDGAPIVIDRSDGTTATYRVTARARFAKDDFPDELIYRLDGPTTLHLVTCGGDFNRRTGHYEDNIVVFAALVSDTASSPSPAPAASLVRSQA